MSFGELVLGLADEMDENKSIHLLFPFSVSLGLLEQYAEYVDGESNGRLYR